MRILKKIAIVTCCAVTLLSKAQDSQYSMYEASLLLLNPAFAGTDENSNLRASSQYRTQWSSVSSSFITSSLTVDIPFKERWGAGAQLYSNDASNLVNEVGFVLSGAYDVLNQDQEKHLLSTGLNLGLLRKSVNEKELFFDNQYESGDFNTSIESGEVLNRTNRILPEVSFGVFYLNKDKNKDYRPYGGVSLFHITKPEESFINKGNSRIPIKWVLNGGMRLFFQNEEIDFDPKFLVIKQGIAWNIMFGFTGGYKVKPNTRLIAGATLRLNDAIIPQLGVENSNFTYGMSYDINISGLNEFSNKRGAVEFYVSYQGISKLFGMETTGVPRM